MVPPNQPYLELQAFPNEPTQVIAPVVELNVCFSCYFIQETVLLLI